MQVALEIYGQRYQHVRHLEQMRATYFNLYLAVVGVAIGAVATICAQSSGRAIEAVLVVCGVVWAFSILSMMRSERWGGHITHDLRAIRVLDNHFIAGYLFLGKAIPVRGNPLRSLKFDRPLWSRDRSIETPTCILGAVLSGAVLGGATYPAFTTAHVLPSAAAAVGSLVLGLVLIGVPFRVWRGEVRHLEERHKPCCSGLPASSQTPTSSAPPRQRSWLARVLLHRGTRQPPSRLR
jgi:hypothetical protein